MAGQFNADEMSALTSYGKNQRNFPKRPPEISGTGAPAKSFERVMFEPLEVPSVGGAPVQSPTSPKINTGGYSLTDMVNKARSSPQNPAYSADKMVGAKGGMSDLTRTGPQYAQSAMDRLSSMEKSMLPSNMQNVQSPAAYYSASSPGQTSTVGSTATPPSYSKTSGMDTKLFGKVEPTSVNPMTKAMGANQYTSEKTPKPVNDGLIPEGWNKLKNSKFVAGAGKVLGALSESAPAIAAGQLASGQMDQDKQAVDQLHKSTGVPEWMAQATSNKGLVSEDAFYPKAGDNGKEQVLASTNPREQKKILSATRGSQGVQDQSTQPEVQGTQPSLLSSQRPALDPYQPAAPQKLTAEHLINLATSKPGANNAALAEAIALISQQNGGSGFRASEPQNATGGSGSSRAEQIARLEREYELGQPDINNPEGGYMGMAGHQGLVNLIPQSMDDPEAQMFRAGISKQLEALRGQSGGVDSRQPTKNASAGAGGPLYTDMNSKGQHVPGQMGKYDGEGLVDSPINRGGYSQDEIIAKKASAQQNGGLVAKGNPLEDQVLNHWKNEIAGGGWGSYSAAKNMAAYLADKDRTQSQTESARAAAAATADYNKERLAETRDYHQGLVGNAKTQAEAAAQDREEKRAGRANTVMAGIYDRLPKDEKEGFNEIMTNISNSGQIKTEMMDDPQYVMNLYRQAKGQRAAARHWNSPHFSNIFDGYFTQPRMNEDVYNPKLGDASDPNSGEHFWSDPNEGEGNYYERVKNAYPTNK